MNKIIYDLVIVGGGPAGMSAALYAARQNLKFILLTKQLGGLANSVPSLKTYLGFYYITGFELIEKFKEHLKHYKINIKNEEVVKITKNKDIFTIRTSEGKYNSKCVIISAGRRFKKLNIPGEDKFTGKGVSDCTICDGPFFKNKIVAVIGGGRSGIFGTLFLLKLAKKIYLIEKDDKLKTGGGLNQFVDIIKKSKNVEIMTNTSLIEIKGNESVKELLLERNGKKEILPIEGVFVEIGYDSNTEFVKELVNTNDRGEIIVDKEGKTHTEGLFAAGDVTDLKEKQVVVSVGEGAKAALTALLYLERKEGN